jgi:hypothetical protein
MLNAARSLALSASSSPELPRVDGLGALYRMGCRPRQGEVIMLAGRSGTGKSSFALWWVSQMNLPTLYFSADMSAYQASVKLACSQMHLTTDEVEERLAGEGRKRREILDKLAALNMTFSFGAISWPGVDAELEAYVELHNSYPSVIVLDNLMDIEGTASDYTMQMEAMQSISDLSRTTGATVLVLHHASDKSWEAKSDPWVPPSRDQVKGGLSEKPELSLSIALDPTSFDCNIAVIKQRMGPCDPTARQYATITSIPSQTRYVEKVYHPHHTAPTEFVV